EVIIVVSPLKMLEENMVQKLCNKGFKVVVLNADTISTARHGGRNLWRECTDGEHQIIFVSPEQLASEEMNKLLSKSGFQSWIRLIIVNEVHLIPVWGVDFWHAFIAIGSLHSRVSSTMVFLALTATLLPGAPQHMVKKLLGLRGSQYSLMKLDCAHNNLYICLCRIDHSISSTEFKDLNQFLTEYNICSAEDLKKIDKMIVYTNTILQGYHGACYLQSHLPGIPNSETTCAIQHLHAVTCPDCKRDILADFSDPDGTSQIVFATNVFGCGIDIPDIARVVNLGTPTTADNAIQ
ncbi:hypothetical protein FRC11_008777, partial [Ceratobasidium sp. 423]